MEELFTCSKEQFRQKIKELSIKEMQQVIWKLEEKIGELAKEIHAAGKINENTLNEKDSAIQLIKLKGDLEQKIRICREIMMNSKYQAVLTEPTDANVKKFSWGIKESEPQLLFQENRRNSNETVSVTSHGEFRWVEQGDLNVDQIPDQRKGINFTVSTIQGEDGKRIVNARDLMVKVNEIKAQTGNLKLFKVTIRGKENIEYFMLISIKDLQTMSADELKQHFIETYLTEAHKKIVIDSLKNERCLYGGSIVRNENGKLETRFYDIYNEAVAKANVSMGTCKTASGKMKFGSMQDILDGISGRTSRTETIQNLTKKINEPER